MKTALKIGFYSGIAILLYTYGVFAYFGDFSNLSYDQISTIDFSGYLRYIIVLAAVYIGMRIAVKTAIAVTFGALFFAGIQVVLVIAIIVGLMEYGYIQFWNPGFYDQYGAIMLQHLKDSGVAQDVIARAQDQLASLEWMKSAVTTGIFYFVETFIVGTIGALLVAWFFKPKAKKAQA